MKIRTVYEDIEIDWDIIKPLYPIVMGGEQTEQASIKPLIDAKTF